MELLEAIAANTVSEDFESDVPAWTKCDCCDDFICNIHGEHAADCSCPPIDVWVSCDRSPYSDSFLWKEGQRTADPGDYFGSDWPEEY